MRHETLRKIVIFAVAAWFWPAFTRAQVGAGPGAASGAGHLSDHRPLQVRGVTLSARTVSIDEPVELTADVAATYDNPFDPGQIAVDAEVTTGDGKTLTVPGFFDVRMRAETAAGRESLVPAGPAVFRVRYTPTLPGKQSVVLTVSDSSGTVRSSPQEITATPGSSPGFLRVSPQSPRYFAFDSGRPYFAVGENVCWSGWRTPLADYAAWFKALGGAGGNWARLWLANNEKGLEWMPHPTPKPGNGDFLGLGRYSQGNAWRLDEIVRLCASTASLSCSAWAPTASSPRADTSTKACG